MGPSACCEAAEVEIGPIVGCEAGGAEVGSPDQSICDPTAVAVAVGAGVVEDAITFVGVASVPPQAASSEVTRVRLKASTDNRNFTLRTCITSYCTYPVANSDSAYHINSNPVPKNRLSLDMAMVSRYVKLPPSLRALGRREKVSHN